MFSLIASASDPIGLVACHYNFRLGYWNPSGGGWSTELKLMPNEVVQAGAIYYSNGASCGQIIGTDQDNTILAEAKSVTFEGNFIDCDSLGERNNRVTAMESRLIKPGEFVSSVLEMSEKRGSLATSVYYPTEYERQGLASDDINLGIHIFNYICEKAQPQI